MALETATYISDLVAANPTASDAKSQGDDHLRLVKSTLKATLPNLTGAMTATHLQLNQIVTAVAVNAAAGAGSVVVDASGNLKAGTGAATASSKIMINTPSGSAAGLQLFQDANESWIMQVPASSTALTWGNSGTERMRIDSSGNLLVGATAYSSTAVNSNSFQLSPSLQAATFNHANGTPSGFTYLNFGYNTSFIGSIAQSGTTSVSYNTTSDYRLKLDQLLLTESGPFIDALKPKSWIWAQDGSRGAGFIAHEFQSVSPTSVSGVKDAVDEDGKPVYQSMQASSAEVMANVIAELQSLRTRVASLEAPT